MVSQKTIQGYPSVQDLSNVRADLLGWVESLAPNSDAQLEIETAQASQGAVQLLFATWNALKAKSVNVKPGEQASVVLDGLTQRSEA